MPKSVYTRAYKLLREALVSARISAGFTQQQLAKQLGRPQSFVAKVEGGERRLDVVELIQIASVLKIDLRPILKVVSAAM